MKSKLKNQVKCFKSTKGLSYGDYVALIDSEEITQVSGIIDATALWVEGCDNDLDVSAVAPARLTKDMLVTLKEAYQSLSTITVEKQGKDFLFKVGKGKISGVFCFQFVHELQHLLRLMEK